MAPSHLSIPYPTMDKRGHKPSNKQRVDKEQHSHSDISHYGWQFSVGLYRPRYEDQIIQVWGHTSNPMRQHVLPTEHDFALIHNSQVAAVARVFYNKLLSLTFYNTIRGSNQMLRGMCIPDDLPIFIHSEIS